MLIQEKVDRQFVRNARVPRLRRQPSPLKYTKRLGYFRHLHDDKSKCSWTKCRPTGPRY